MKVLSHTLWVVCLFVAVSAGATQPQYRKKKNRNLSLRISARPNDKLTTYASIGLIEATERLHGVSINLGGTVSSDKSAGVQIGGIFNVSEHFSGLSVAGITNVYEKASGIAISGLVNVGQEFKNGVQLTSLVNVAQQQKRALSISLLMNVSQTSTHSIQLSALTNVSGVNRGGLMLTGLGNISTENSGVQIAGFSNIAIENSGVNMALLNISATNNGLQLGGLNITSEEGRGLQVGLVNISRKDDIRQLGLVNLKPSTQKEYQFTVSNTDALNAGIRFKNKYTYTQLGLSSYHFGLSSPFTLSGVFRAGLYRALGTRWEVYGDLGYKHIEAFRNKNEGKPRRLYAFQPRVGITYMPFARFGFTLSGGYEWARTYGNGYQKGKTTVELGIVLR